MKVQITGYVSNQFKSISFLHLLRQLTGDDLGSAKNRLDGLTDGEIIEIEVDTRDSAEKLVRRCSNIGVRAKVVC